MWSCEFKRLWSIAVEILEILSEIVKRRLGGRVRSISLVAYTRVSRTVLVSRAMSIRSTLSTLIRMANFLLPSTTSTENVSNKTCKTIGHCKKLLFTVIMIFFTYFQVRKGNHYDGCTCQCSIDYYEYTNYWYVFYVLRWVEPKGRQEPGSKLVSSSWRIEDC